MTAQCDAIEAEGLLSTHPNLRAPVVEGLLRLGDGALILGHRLSEWCGHGPALEEDIAMANTALDLVGHARMWLGLAGTIEGKGRSADDLAYLRDAAAFRNPSLVELPNGDIGRTLMRQFLYDAWHHEMLAGLEGSAILEVAEIAGKARKEVAYHLDRSSDLVVRLGDGTVESHARMQDALDMLWPHARELGCGDSTDAQLADARVMPAIDTVIAAWDATVGETLEEATLTRPESDFAHRGARQGRHTEHLGFLLAEMQFLQRAYPGAEW